MHSEDDKIAQQKRPGAAYLVKETGITADEAMVLIELISLNLSSLVREARILKKQKDDML